MNDSRPRIAMVTHSLDRGGSPISLWNLATRLRGFEPVIFSEKSGPLESRYSEAGLPVEILPRSGLLEMRLVLRYIKAFRRYTVRLVHLNTLTSYYKYPALAARLLGIPIVWFIREDVRERRCLKLHGWIKRLAKRIVPVSHEIANSLYGSAPPEKVRVIYNGIDPTPTTETSNLRAQLGIPSDTRIVGCVAALEKRKGIVELVQAVGELKKMGINAALVCLGADRSREQSYLKKLQTLALELQINGRVHFLGDFPNPISAYPEFDLFVLPSFWEGCARTLLEAMLQRAPVITTDGGGNPEVIIEGKTGLIVSTGDSKALAAAIAELLGNPLLAKGFAEAAHADLLKRFTLERHVENVSALYREVLGG